MKRTLVIAISLIFFVFVGFGWLIELEPETWETYELKGRVKTLTITFEVFDDFDSLFDDWDDWDDDDFWSDWDDEEDWDSWDDWDDWALPGKIVIAFNEFGKVTYEGYFDEAGNLMEEYEYVFDRDGVLIGIPFDESLGVTELVITDGKIEKIAFDIPGEGLYLVTMGYDARGNLVEQVMGGGEGEDYFEMSMSASYDSEDRMIEELTYFFGELWSKIVFEYDAAGRKIAEHEYVYFWGDEPDAFTTRFEYDERGNLVRELEESPYYPEPDITEYHYDYDSEGNILQMVVLDSWGEVTLYVYELDGQGNYTKKTTYFLYDPEMLAQPDWLDYAEVYEIEYREIEYF